MIVGFEKQLLFAHVNKLVTSIWLALSGLAFFGCENDLKEVEKFSTYEDLPLQTITNSKITYTDSTIVTFTVKAGQIDRLPSEEDAYDKFTKGVEVVTYNKNGGFESQINADKATNYTKRKIMIARDSVILRNYEGKMLQTELLTWDNNTQRIYTDEFVKITTPNEILFGDGLEAKSDFSEYEIQNITGRIKIDSEESEEPKEE